jgi:hypothetical protein
LLLMPLVALAFQAVFRIDDLKENASCTRLYQISGFVCHLVAGHDSMGRSPFCEAKVESLISRIDEYDTISVSQSIDLDLPVLAESHRSNLILDAFCGSGSRNSDAHFRIDTIVLAVALEFVVELARITTLLVIIGHGNLSNGIQKVVGIFRFSREQWSGFSRAVRRTFSQQWTVLLWNLLLFSLVAYAFNWANGVIADHSSVLLFLKDNGFMNESASGMPVFFFLKNLTVVPFTLVFDYILLRWLTGKLTFAGLTVQTGA